MNNDVAVYQGINILSLPPPPPKQKKTPAKCEEKVCFETWETTKILNTPVYWLGNEIFFILRKS